MSFVLEQRGDPSVWHAEIMYESQADCGEIRLEEETPKMFGQSAPEPSTLRRWSDFAIVFGNLERDPAVISFVGSE